MALEELHQQQERRSLRMAISLSSHVFAVTNKFGLTKAEISWMKTFETKEEKDPYWKKKYWRSFISCAADRNRWETFPRLAYFVWLYFCVIVVVFPWFSLFPFFTQRIMLIYVVLFISQTVSVFLSVHNDRESLSMFALWRIFLPFPFSWCFSWRK